MVIICYGMIKSASTFTYQVVQELVKKHCAKLGIDYVSLSDLDIQFKYNFVDARSDFKQLLSVFENSGLDVFGNQHVLIKTHAPPIHFRDLLQRREVLTIANYRHPAEVVLSLVDAARKDKAQGRNRFDKYDTLDKAASQLPYQCQSFMAWNTVSRVHNVYYDNLVSEPVWTFKKLVNFLCIDEDPVPILKEFLNSDRKIYEFNKGILGRRFNELSLDEIASIEGEFPEFSNFIKTNSNK